VTSAPDAASIACFARSHGRRAARLYEGKDDMTDHRPSRRRHLKPALIAGVTAVALTGGAAAQANAAESTTTALQQSTSTVDHAWQQGTVREQYAVQTRIAGSRATLTDRRGNRLGVSFAGMRKGAKSHKAGNSTVFTNGLGRGVDAAVQRTSGGVRMMSVIRSAKASTVYRYPLQLPKGATLQLQSSGVVLIRDAAGRAVGAVRAPWALDANGVRVATRFEVRGRTLIQHVAHRGAAYPVVADPSIDFGLTSATITLNAKDQRILLSGGGAGAGALIGGLLCSETGPGAVLCAAGGAVIGTMVFEAIKEYAVRENCEVHVKIGYFPPGVQDAWTTCS
jgi:hypothetical protein